MSLLKQHNLTNNETFRTRVQTQAIKESVYNLSLSSLTRTQAEQLHIYKRILSNPNDNHWLNQLVAIVANNATILTATDEDGVNTSPDSDIEYTVQTEGLPKLNL